MTHVVVDIETMGTSPNAPVLSVGAVEFDHAGIKREFYAECSIRSAMGAGAEADPDTIAWWMLQGDEARLKMANATGESSVMLAAFCDWFPDNATFWGNGATFDNVVLRQAIIREGLTPPWVFWNDRCYRTVKNMFPSVAFSRVGVHHNALDDAKSQALHLIDISMQHGEFLL